MSQKKKKLERKLIEKKVEFKPDLSNWEGIRQILKNNWKFLAVLIFGVILIYWNSLRGDFVSDDYATISQNPLVKDLGLSLKTLSLPTWSNWFLAVIFGSSNPLPFHSFNLILYIVSIILGFILVQMLCGKKIAILSSIVFAVMPIHVEAVSWVSGKPYLFNAVFVLIELILSVSFLKTGRKKYLWMALANLPLMFLADKIRSFAYVFLMIFVLVAFKNEVLRIRINYKKIVLWSVIIIGLVTIYVWPFIHERVTSVNSGYNQTESNFYNPFFQYPTAVTKYLQLILMPSDLTLYHTMYILPAWLNWAVILSYLTLLLWSYFKDKKIFFGLAFIFAAAAPSMAPVKVSWLVAERYMFLGSLGFAIFIAAVIDKLTVASKNLLYLPLILLVLFYGWRVYYRNIDWQTNHKLWVNTVQVSPNSHNAWNNIGDDYDKLGDLVNAVKGFGQSYVVKPNYADAYHNQGNILYKMNRLDLARQAYTQAINYSPGLYQSYISLTQIDLTEKRLDLALQHSQKTVEMQPSNPTSRYVFGFVLAQAGMLEEAKKQLEAVLMMDPNNVQAKEILSKIANVNVQQSTAN